MERNEGEKLQQGGGIGVQRAELVAGIGKVPVGNELRLGEVGSPGLDVVGDVGLSQLVSEGGAVDGGPGRGAENPFFSTEVGVGVQDCVLHEGEAILAEGAQYRIVVDDVLRGAGELAVEVERRELVVGGGQHALVDVLESLEAIEVEAGMGDNDVVAGPSRIGHAGGWFGEQTGIVRELSMSEVGEVGIR